MWVHKLAGADGSGAAVPAGLHLRTSTALVQMCGQLWNVSIRPQPQCSVRCWGQVDIGCQMYGGYGIQFM